MRNPSIPSKPAAEIQDWLVTWIADELSFMPEEIDIQEPFVNFGLSSRQAVFMAGELEDWLGQVLDPRLAWDYPTIEKLAEHLAIAHAS